LTEFRRVGFSTEALDVVQENRTEYREQDGVQENMKTELRTEEQGGVHENREEYRRTGRSTGEHKGVQEKREEYRRTGRSTGEEVEIQENRTEYMRLNPLPPLLRPPPCPLSIPSQFVLFRRNIGFIRFVSPRFMRFQSKI